ncbi:alpha-amylase [Pseudoalteromonas sp. MSK9-3]|nr:alpha-amylase family glycosyl hydrolase [Pseudoalteromonas sp. MSK9-3]RJE75925.1 alpha-amylase [Pseudoalteromonas sp. MSK9-3]
MTTSMHVNVMKRRRLVSGMMTCLLLGACTHYTFEFEDKKQQATTYAVNATSPSDGKPVVYQVFTRLFGNTQTANIPWGTASQNGVGKFKDFTPKALTEIKKLGVTHMWYTGVLHHAMVSQNRLTEMQSDDPDVVKGRAGSPYAIKDYYNVNPDLALNPQQRMNEFSQLITRTHQAGMKVIIDIVPNHVARNYHSTSQPEGVSNFGEGDDVSVEYARDNNFYYVTGKAFSVPNSESYKPLGGQPHHLSDGQFTEFPAKWTGNGARAAQPSIDDWYETVKVNYGVKPDGSYDFPRLPANFADKGISEHYAFWQQQNLPNSWYKFREIVYFWLDKGVDGFRYDMAEMVPVEFWSFLNSSIKNKNPHAFLLAEVYNPTLYRPYIHQGKMDYLYDKVGFYDSLKALMQQTGSAKQVMSAHRSVQDIAPHMLHFLENHDEQRIASPEFVGDARMGKPAMVVSHLISQSPSMLYFGQTVGEDGSENAGFGQPSRTSIFDYIGVPAHQAWMNHGAFDGGLLSQEQRSLRAFYETLMPLNNAPAVANGQLTELGLHNASDSAKQRIIAFTREHIKQQLLVISNFDAKQSHTVTLKLPKSWHSHSGVTVTDLLHTRANHQIDALGLITLTLAPRESVVYQKEK